MHGNNSVTIKPKTMTSAKIKRTRISPKAILIHKSAYLTNEHQQLVESNNDQRPGRLQINQVKTKEENYLGQSPAPAQWFSDWNVDGGERRRIEVCQSEAKNNKYGNLKASDFCFS